MIQLLMFILFGVSLGEQWHGRNVQHQWGSHNRFPSGQTNIYTGNNLTPYFTKKPNPDNPAYQYPYGPVNPNTPAYPQPHRPTNPVNPGNRKKLKYVILYQNQDTNKYNVIQYEVDVPLTTPTQGFVTAGGPRPQSTTSALQTPPIGSVTAGGLGPPSTTTAVQQPPVGNAPPLQPNGMPVLPGLEWTQLIPQADSALGVNFFVLGVAAQDGAAIPTPSTPTIASFGPSPGTQGNPSGSFGPSQGTNQYPSGSYGPPQGTNQYPSGSYGPPQETHGNPSRSYGPPQGSSGSYRPFGP